MECEETDHGVSFPGWRADAGRRRALKRKLETDEVDVERTEAVAAGGAPAPQTGSDAVVSQQFPPTHFFPLDAPDDPFMSKMDEITYWINTKRAPCLMNYDGLAKNYFESVGDSKLIKSDAVATPSPTKKKRKVFVLEEEECVSEKQQNVYFEAPQREQQKVLSSCKSESVDSDIDFVIRNSSIQEKSKVRTPKSNPRVHKKNKVITSTPLRRSLRRAQNYIVHNDQLNISNETYLVGHATTKRYNSKNEKANLRSKKVPEKISEVDTSFDCKKNNIKWNKPKNDTQNGQFEDLSDVSGFTANYIRSTKVHANGKCPRNLRSKNKRNLVRESHQNSQNNDGTMLLFVNKGVNATNNNNSALNCSTDSSQNILNLITTQNSENCKKVDRSTSLLKFINLKSPKDNGDVQTGESSLIKVIDLDVSFQSKSTTGNSRYPRRNKKNTAHNENLTIDSMPTNQVTRASVENKKKSGNPVQTKPCGRKENPKEKINSRTRNGRNCKLRVQQPQSNVLVYCNSTEQLSDSVNTLNVGVQTDESKGKMRSKRLSASKYASHARKSVDRWGKSLNRDSDREKSGFTACFSDSEEDDESQKHRKYFC